jgi:hypothetical protein
MRAHTLAITLWAGLTLAAAAAAPVRPTDVERRIVVPLTDAPFEQLIDHPAGADAAWLVLDPDWRGEVRSHDDLITNGFAALRELDENADGELTGGELTVLSLWRDENGNGVSEPGEVLPANVHGIASLSLEDLVMHAGIVTAPVGMRLDDGRTRPLFDWRP